MNHSFDIEIARTYSVNIAIFLDHIAFWTQKNIANQKHFHKNYYWTYSSYEAFTDIFPYWTIDIIRKLIKKCISLELLIKSNFNFHKYDQTNWYALTIDGIKLFPIVMQQYYTQVAKLPDEAQQGLLNEKIEQTAPSLSWSIGQIDLVNRPHRSGQKTRPIPDTIPDTIPDKDITPLPPKVKKKDLAVIDPEFKHQETYYPKPDISGQSQFEKMNMAKLVFDNQFNFPETLIAEWFDYRKKMRYPISQTVWDEMKSELHKCKDPEGAFRKVVNAGWKSFSADWVEKDLKGKLDHEDTTWINKVKEDLF